MEKCVFPAKYGELKLLREARVQKWRATFFWIFILSATLRVPWVNAGPHYVDLPAYQDRFLLKQKVPPDPGDVFIEIGPAETKTQFLLYRPTLCRIDLFNPLLCSSFKEASTPVVQIGEDITNLNEFLHLIDVAYLGRIEVRSAPTERKSDLQGLLTLSRSDHFKKVRETGSSGAHISRSIHTKIFEWIEKEPFKPTAVDITFLSLFFLDSFDPSFLDTQSAEERAWFLSKKNAILNDISSLCLIKDLTPAEDAQILKEVRAHAKNEALRVLVEKRLNARPKDHLFKGLSRLIADDSDEE
jgi:hypothetical protein